MGFWNWKCTAEWWVSNLLSMCLRAYDVCFTFSARPFSLWFSFSLSLSISRSITHIRSNPHFFLWLFPRVWVFRFRWSKSIQMRWHAFETHASVAQHRVPKFMAKEMEINRCNARGTIISSLVTVAFFMFGFCFWCRTYRRWHKQANAYAKAYPQFWSKNYRLTVEFLDNYIHQVIRKTNFTLAWM